MPYPIIFAFLGGIAVFAMGKMFDIKELKQLGGGFATFVGLLIFLSLAERFLF